MNKDFCFFLILVVGLVVLGCVDRLPEDFMDLPLEEKIAATERFYASGGLTSYEAVSGISLHGHDAARAMVPYLRGKDGIPLLEVLHIVEQVQLRGCSLRGSEAEAALRQLHKKADSDEISEQVTIILQDIEENRMMPDRLDTLGAGTCQPSLD